MFVKLKDLPFSHSWRYNLLQKDGVFAVKIGVWLVYKPDAERLIREKKTHKRKISNFNNLGSNRV
jgi:hypothetical protein